jgi:hypothetical protein
MKNEIDEKSNRSIALIIEGALLLHFVLCVIPLLVLRFFLETKTTYHNVAAHLLASENIESLIVDSDRKRNDSFV